LNARQPEATKSQLIQSGIRRREAMRILIADFQKAGIDDPSLDARALLCAAAEIEHIDLIRDPDAMLDDVVCDRLSRFHSRRLRREPVSRILAKRGFWSLDLVITPDVLDPRPDSETLVDAALEFFSDRQEDALHVADLGTGSGALLCALLDIFPKASGVAVDISPAACAVARRNLAECGFGGRSAVVEGDWATLPPGPYDIIVSNPPYIPSDVIVTLEPEVRDFDPLTALDAGPDGLDAYRAIAPLLAKRLKPEGLAILETGFDQNESVRAILAEQSLYLVGSRCDHGGRHRAILTALNDILVAPNKKHRNSAT
jgi:release factor glutamine methyltransferase